MSLKYELLVLVLCLASLVDCNDIMLGHASPYSKKIYSAVKIADPALWQRTADIMINAPYHDYINAVYITDLRPDKDGEAYIEAGGLGSKTVTIALKSPSVLRGYKFSIEIYAESIHQYDRYYHHSGYMGNMYNTVPLSGYGGVGINGGLGYGAGGYPVSSTGIAQYPSYPSSYPNRMYK